MIGSSREKASIVGWDGFKVRLKEMGLKNRDASKIMSVSEEMIRQYKKRGFIPSADVIYRLAMATGKSMEWWLTGMERPIHIDEIKLSQEFYLRYPFLKKVAQSITEAVKENDHHMIVKQFEYAAERIKNFHETEEPPRPRPSRKNFPATSSK